MTWRPTLTVFRGTPSRRSNSSQWGRQLPPEGVLGICGGFYMLDRRYWFGVEQSHTMKNLPFILHYRPVLPNIHRGEKSAYNYLNLEWNFIYI